MTDEITLDAPETRLERFLAAAAGVEGITLDEPETRIERYLYMIAQGSGGVPAVEDADKGKYLYANESTGDLEWATAGGSGGGVLVVTETGGTLDKTWQEIYDAAPAVIFGRTRNDGKKTVSYLENVYESDGSYTVAVGVLGGLKTVENIAFSASSADGYPTFSV